MHSGVGLAAVVDQPGRTGLEALGCRRSVTFGRPPTSYTGEMDGDRLSRHFEATRPRLRALGYRMLGSYEEAEDAVQETWLRVGSAGSTEVDNLYGWFITIVA